MLVNMGLGDSELQSLRQSLSLKLKVWVSIWHLEMLVSTGPAVKVYIRVDKAQTVH